MTPPIILYEDEGCKNLAPLVWWRSVFELRVGRKILMDRITQSIGFPIGGVWTRPWLADVTAQRCGAPSNQPAKAGIFLVNGRWMTTDPVEFPSAPLVGDTEGGIAYIACDASLASKLTPEIMLSATQLERLLKDIPRQQVKGRLLQYPWDVIVRLCEILEKDWHATDATIDTDLDPQLHLDNPNRFHIGERTSIHPSVVLDTTQGAIFISHDVQIAPFAVIEGPVYIGPGCRMMAHAHIHGGNAFGPVCKIGGEVCGSIWHAYCNKQHTGFLGHSYLGSWVNLGAGATNSNLKNTYGKIRVPLGGVDIESGLQFLGAIIGDHVKVGINASLPTGAVIGLGTCTASTRLLPKYLPSYSWVTDEGIRQGDPMRILDIAAAAMKRRDVDMTDEEVQLMHHLGEHLRDYEKSTG